MKGLSIFVLLIVVFISCKNSTQNNPQASSQQVYYQIVNDEFELYLPEQKIDRVLVLYGGYPETAIDIRREFQILKPAQAENIAILFMNYNQKLWLEESEKVAQCETLEAIFSENKLPFKDVYFGGFSSGGNVALIISDFLVGNEYRLVPSGVFIVDSPIDLVALYKSSEKNIHRNFSAVSVGESKWIIKTLTSRFGNPYDSLNNYEGYSVYLSETNDISLLHNLKDVKIRLYTEPDTLWWKENRMASYDQMNAFYIKKLAAELKKNNFTDVDYIPTQNKGYRADGMRHPHSWSIVDPEELVEWMINMN